MIYNIGSREVMGKYLRFASHVGIKSNEKVDSLSSTASEEEASPTVSLTFCEFFSLKKIDLNQLERIPPSHNWYFGRNPGGSFRFMSGKNADRLFELCERSYKSSHFASGPGDIPEVPLVLFRSGLPCPYLDLYGFLRGRGPSEPFFVLGIF
ncbi:hypothetical protein TNCT_241691 [Trichonephila clavata]|uniref:Uncharacterized protein n=1 Tax=Trichonephila clavata TaxID=2740835 RepID=A0A8X6FEE9_TRICU|nr:hypothetical protein TNCT_241691 [Trichonephila clavata]